MRLSLDIHGISACLESDDASVLDGLRRDFALFEAEPSARPALRLTLVRAEPPNAGPRWSVSLSTRRWTARDRGSLRSVRYADGPLCVFDYATGRGSLWCADGARLHELAGLLLLSRAGEALDRRGLHRVHALGFERDGEAGLLLLPSGGGKSTLALELLRRSRLNVLSDDAPLVSRDGTVHPFPLRWGFRPDADLSGVPPELVRSFRRRDFGPKRLVDAEYFRARVGRPARLRWLLVGRRGEEAALGPLSRAPALAALAQNLVVGHGLAQMAEHTLRADRLTLLARIAAARAKTALALVDSARLYRFTLGGGPAASADALAGLLEARPEREAAAR